MRRKNRGGRSVASTAESSIWALVVDVFYDALRAPWGEMLAGSVAFVINVLILLLCPLSFPIIAVIRRRAARKEMAEWKAREALRQQLNKEEP